MRDRDAMTPWLFSMFIVMIEMKVEVEVPTDDIEWKYNIFLFADASNTVLMVENEKNL